MPRARLLADDRRAETREFIMKGLSVALFCIAVLLTLATPAFSHDCRVRDAYLRGSYEGDCDDRTEMAQGKGEAKGADTYVGEFAKGRPTGKGVYTWENGARLDGSFKEGKAHGLGIYVSAKGARYEGQFVNGKLEGLKTADCPTTPGPVTC
jgi:hypothetical protein